MISLLAHFGHQECLVKKISQGNLFPEDSKAKALNYVVEINANCLAYSAAIMGKAKQCRVIMVPNLSEAIPDYASSDAGMHGGRSMSLGHLVSNFKSGRQGTFTLFWNTFPNLSILWVQKIVRFS